MATQTLISWKNVQRVLDEFGREFVEVYRKRLQSGGVNTSKASLSNSVSYEVRSGNTWIAVDISLLEYWQYIEHGRKPGKMPPISAIEQWIKIKPIVPRAYGGKKPPTTKTLAFLIARKIGLEGIAPRPHFQGTMDALLRSFDKALDDAVAQDVGEGIDKIMMIYKK